MNSIDWRQLHHRLVHALRPTQNAVAIKFIRDEEALHAIPGARFFSKPGMVCQAIGISAHYDVTAAIRSQDFAMNYCGACNGCQPQDAAWQSGETLAKHPFKWFRDEQASAAHIQAMQAGCPSDDHIAVVTSPLAKGDIPAPDVVSLQLLPGAAFHLLSGLIEKDYRKLEFPFIGESSCADTWGYTYNTGKPGLSLGCRGDRSAGALASHEVRLTLVPADLVKALDGIDRLAQDSITYPYYPNSILLDF